MREQHAKLLAKHEHIFGCVDSQHFPMGKEVILEAARIHAMNHLERALAAQLRGPAVRPANWYLSPDREWLGSPNVYSERGDAI